MDSPSRETSSAECSSTVSHVYTGVGPAEGTFFDASQIARALDKQGKAGLRRGLIDSLERLRKASKNNIPPILDVVRRQAADLAQVPTHQGKLTLAKGEASRPNEGVAIILLKLQTSPGRASTLSACFRWST